MAVMWNCGFWRRTTKPPCSRSRKNCPRTTCCFCAATSVSPRSSLHGWRQRDAVASTQLTQEAFALAIDLGVEKLMAQMTVDQRGAIGVFEGLGFRAEALLHDHVKDRGGKTHDIVILSHDVAKFQAQMSAYGLTEALQ
jgi:hypothetical protein